MFFKWFKKRKRIKEVTGVVKETITMHSGITPVGVPKVFEAYKGNNVKLEINMEGKIARPKLTNLNFYSIPPKVGISGGIIHAYGCDIIGGFNEYKDKIQWDDVASLEKMLVDSGCAKPSRETEA